MSTNSRESREKSWVETELEDSFDEELEMELDDERVGEKLRKIVTLKREPTIDRRLYFRELLRLQAELVKVQDWDLQSRARWEDYTKTKEEMFERTNIPEAPWWIVEGNDKKRARLNCIHHLLGQVPYQDVPHQPITLPDRVFNPDYERKVLPDELYVADIY